MAITRKMGKIRIPQTCFLRIQRLRDTIKTLDIKLIIYTDSAAYPNFRKIKDTGIDNKYMVPVKKDILLILPVA